MEIKCYNVPTVVISWSAAGKKEWGLEVRMWVFVHCAVNGRNTVINVCVGQASREPNCVTYNPWGFGALCGIVGKAATVTSGDCVWLLVTEAHGVHRLASAADDPLQRETRRYCQWIHFWYNVEMQHTDVVSRQYIPHKYSIYEFILKLSPNQIHVLYMYILVNKYTVYV